MLKRRSSGKARRSRRAAVRRSPKRRTYKGVDARVYYGSEEMAPGEREINGPVIQIDGPASQIERARELEELAWVERRERVRDNPSSEEAKEMYAVHEEITQKLKTLYTEPQGEEDPEDERFQIPSRTQEPTEDTMMLWNELIRSNRTVFPSPMTEYEKEADAILSQNIGKEQLELWLQAAFEEAKRSNFESTTLANDGSGRDEHHQKREQVMKMVQQKIQAKLDAMEF